MRSKHLFLIFAISIISIIGFIAYGSFTFSQMFRPYGDRGATYETWETANNNFKVKITALHEEGVYLGGAYFVCESAPIESNQWREFKAFRVDDPNPIPHQRFHFVSEQTAYIYMADDFVVTVDGGQTWKVWRPLLPQPDGKLVYWGFVEATVETDGNGRAKLWRYDEQVKDRVEIEIRTNNFGQTWSVVKS
jgi:hypothetical protein